MAWQAAKAATMVLPAPTSPCSKRCIGCGCARSCSISSSTRCCAPVRPKGKLASNLRASSPLGAICGAFFFAPYRACHAQAELLRQQLIKLEALPRRMRALGQLDIRNIWRGGVQQFNAGGKRRQAQRFEDFGGGGYRASRWQPAPDGSAWRSDAAPSPRWWGTPG